MTEILLGFLVIVLSLIGTVSSLRFLLFRVYKCKQDKTIMLINPAQGICEDIEYTLRSCAAKVRWMGKVRPYMVICLDNGMDKSTRSICEKVCSEYEFMCIMNTEQLNKTLNSK